MKLGMIVLGIAITGTAYAAGQPVPHIFQGGQKAVASQVNENFQNLSDRIAAGGELESGSTYRGTGITAKTFIVTDISGSCTTFENHTFVSSNGGATITQTIIGRAGSGGAQCVRQVWTHQSGGAGVSVTQIASFDASDNPTGTTTYSPGILYLPAQLHNKMSWALDTNTTVTPAVGSPTAGTFLGEYTIVSKESVTVPAGTYDNCLKITRQGFGATVGSLNNPSFRIEWRCPGIGLVKRRESNGITRELNSVTQ